jgi:hypothetical protein
MRRPFSVALLFSFALVWQPLSSATSPGQRKVENPWKALPVGTVLEFKTTADESESLRKTTAHEEAIEVWTVVANNGKVATIEVAKGGVKARIERDLSPVDALPVPPPEPADNSHGQVTAVGAPDGQDRTIAAYDRLDTPFGTLDCIRIDHRMVMLEGGSNGSEWRAPGYPEPLKVTSVHSGGAGVVRTRSETRTLVRFDVPGSSWRDLGVGTNFDVKVEREHRVEFPEGQAPTVDASLERWTLTRKDAQAAAFDVVVGGTRSEKTLPIAFGPLPANGSRQGTALDHTDVTVSAETIETPLGRLDCTAIHKRHTMNEAGGEDVEWRATGFPVAVRTRSLWAHKQQVDIETRTVVRFERVK